MPFLLLSSDDSLLSYPILSSSCSARSSNLLMLLLIEVLSQGIHSAENANTFSILIVFLFFPKGIFPTSVSQIRNIATQWYTPE